VSTSDGVNQRLADVTAAGVSVWLDRIRVRLEGDATLAVRSLSQRIAARLGAG
jgi:hypothetical protein